MENLKFPYWLNSLWGIFSIFFFSFLFKLIKFFVHVFLLLNQVAIVALDCFSTIFGAFIREVEIIISRLGVAFTTNFFDSML